VGWSRLGKGAFLPKPQAKTMEEFFRFGQYEFLEKCGNFKAYLLQMIQCLNVFRTHWTRPLPRTGPGAPRGPAWNFFCPAGKRGRMKQVLRK